ncbi:MAG: AmpG family muropeptide MFS transporter [Myxococcota bacterium]|nr:AmpG family muropeptide MFS transporter [Myxococcota bacterium]
MSAAPRKTSFWAAFSSPRLALMIGLGFASGLPNPLTGSTLTAWLETQGLSIEMIGATSILALPYNLKVFWAPLLDRFRIPRLGRRRGWMLLAQLCLVGCIAAMGSVDPRGALYVVFALAVAIAFFSASQDVVSDAYRTDLLPFAQRASGTAIFVASYRAAMIVASAVALFVADLTSWSVTFWVMAALMTIGVLTTLIAPTPESEGAAPRSLRDAVVEPLKEYFRRDRALTFLAIIMLYKLGDVVAGHLLNPFLLRTGFSLTEIAALGKGLGLAATIVGALLGGGLVARFGLRPSLIVFGVLQGVANLTYAALALVGKSYLVLALAIGADNFLNGLGTAAFVALLMTLCDRRFTATQYALFSSLSTVPGRLFGMASGWIVSHSGWPLFFVLSLVAALPAIGLLFTVRIEERPEPV